MHLPDHSVVRRALLLALLVVMLAVLVPLVASRLDSMIVNDFMEYWSAGRLVLAGGDPYAPAQMLAVEQSQGWPAGEPPIMMYNPPWSLPVTLPFAFLPYRLAYLLWFALQFACIIISAVWLWAFYGGRRRSWLPFALSLSFFPTLLVLRMGQISPVMLLGLTGFLMTVRRRPFAAGLWLGLLALKPQLLYLFWPALLLWSLRRRSWGTLLGLTCAVGGASTIALLLDRSAVVQFIQVMATYRPDYVTPTLGTLLRLLFGPSFYYLQFVSCVLGLVWLRFSWRKYGDGWDWASQAPLLILVSLATTPYGWMFDAVVALPALLSVALEGVAPLPTALYVAINVLAIGLNLAGLDAVWYLWFAPALLGCYLLGRRWGRSRLSVSETAGAAPS